MTEAFVGALMTIVVPGVVALMTIVVPGVVALMTTVVPGVVALMTSAVPGEVALMTSAAPDAVQMRIVDREGDLMMTVVPGADWMSPKDRDVALMMTGVLGEAAVVMMREEEEEGGAVMTPGLGNLWVNQKPPPKQVVGERGRRPVRRAGVLRVTLVLVMMTMAKTMKTRIVRESVSESGVLPGRRESGGKADLMNPAVGVTVDVTTLIATIGVNAVTSEIAGMTVIVTGPCPGTLMMADRGAVEEKTAETNARMTLRQDHVSAMGKEVPGAQRKKRTTHAAPRTRRTTTAGPQCAAKHSDCLLIAPTASIYSLITLVL